MNRKEKIEKLENSIRNLSIKLRNLKDQELVEVSLPKLRKVVGKCFKYINSYGGSDPTKRWPLYVKVVGIDEKTMAFKTVEFQRTSADIIEIKYDVMSNWDGTSRLERDYIPIKVSEYNRARKALLKFVQKVMS